MSLLIRVVYWVLIESYMDWIDVGSRGPLRTVDSCNMALKLEPKVR